MSAPFGEHDVSTRLDLSDRDLAHLGDIGSAIAQPDQLAELDLSRNPLRSLAGLPHLPALHTLLATRCALQSLDGLAAAPALSCLSISFNPIEDLGPLATVPRLHTLYARQVPYATLAPLQHLPLQALTLTVYELADLTLLDTMGGLTALHLSGPALAGLRALPQLGQLSALSLTHAPLLTQAPFLAHAKGLRALSLAFTGVVDVAALAALPLTSLDLRGTPAAEALAASPPDWLKHIGSVKLR